MTGPLRAPRQILSTQEVRGRAGLHNTEVANSLGLAGAPIEAPTHFSQFDPLAFLNWGPAWFERGCISAHFRNMVAEGELVCASLATKGATEARIEAHRSDDTPVLVGTASLGHEHAPTELDRRLATLGDPGRLFLVDQLQVGMSKEVSTGVSIRLDQGNGPLYPFSLAEKLESITEPHPWYTAEGAASSPWGRAILPMEMVSVLAHKIDPMWPVRTPTIGLFLDLEVRLVNGPVFVDQEYTVSSEIVGLSASRRTESFWSLTTLLDIGSGATIATVLLHSGLFKASYPGYPNGPID